MFEISKKFELDYGHRVHTQELDSVYSLDNKCACRHLHGHRGVITVTLKGVELEKRTQMLTDFKHLNWFKKFVDENLDHKMILDEKDPNLSLLFPTIASGEILLKKSAAIPNAFSIVDFDNPKNWRFTELEKEIYEGLVFVPFCPTSENLSKWFYEIVKDKMRGISTISSVKIDFSETPKSNACYYE